MGFKIAGGQCGGLRDRSADTNGRLSVQQGGNGPDRVRPAISAIDDLALAIVTV